MNEHPSTGPAAPATERIPTDPQQAGSPVTERFPLDAEPSHSATERVPVAPPQVSAPATEKISTGQQAAPTTPVGEAPVHPADAAYLPAREPAPAA